MGVGETGLALRINDVHYRSFSYGKICSFRLNGETLPTCQDLLECHSCKVA